MPLESETLKLMAEAFSGLACHDCGHAAGRVHHYRPFCHGCYDRRYGSRPVTVRTSGHPEGVLRASVAWGGGAVR